MDYLAEDRNLSAAAIAAYRVGEDDRGNLIFPFLRPDGSLAMAKRRAPQDDAKPVPTEAECEPILFRLAGHPGQRSRGRDLEGEIDAASWYDYGWPALWVPFGGGAPSRDGSRASTTGSTVSSASTARSTWTGRASRPRSRSPIGCGDIAACASACRARTPTPACRRASAAKTHDRGHRRRGSTLPPALSEGPYPTSYDTGGGNPQQGAEVTEIQQISALSSLTSAGRNIADANVADRLYGRNRLQPPRGLPKFEGSEGSSGNTASFVAGEH